MPGNDWPQDRQWLLSCLHYRMSHVYGEADENGDALLQAVYRPLIERLQSAMPDAIISWMRFCARGYHMRLHVFAGEAQLRELASPLITAAIDAARRSQPSLQGAVDELPALAQRVSLKFSGQTSPLPLGSHELSPLRPGEADGHYASFARFQLVQRLLACEAQHSLMVLAQTGSYGERLMFWRHYLVQAVQALALSREQAAYVLSHWASRWGDFFAMDPAQCQQRLAQQAPLQALAQLLRQDQPAWRSEALSAPLAQALRRLSAAQATVPRPPAELDDPQWPTQAITLMHLCANRLGVSAVDECATAGELGRLLADAGSACSTSDREASHAAV